MSGLENTVTALATNTFPKKISASKKLIKANHPSTDNIVNAVLIALNEAKGSSVQTIKKYITGTYLVDLDKKSSHIKKYLNTIID
jgi:hypothetical protein